MNHRHSPIPQTSASPAGMIWNDDMLVGHPTIDEMHLEFVDLANAMLHCSADSAAGCLAEIDEHVRQHFANEKALMDRTDFPATDCHVDEHEKVADTVRHVRALHSRGDVSLNDVHRLAQALIDWFPGHIFYMDSALSAWVTKKTHSGAPLVFRNMQARA